MQLEDRPYVRGNKTRLVADNVFLPGRHASARWYSAMVERGMRHAFKNRRILSCSDEVYMCTQIHGVQVLHAYVRGKGG